jgi:hypothetical protein
MKNLVPLNLNPAPLKLSQKEGQVYVWDQIRKKHLVLTPEEWVRQHLIHYFISELQVPLAAFSLEGGFRLNGKLKRSDILIYKNAQPCLLVECKAPQVKISQDTFDQASRYNMHYQLPYLAISNGLEHYWLRIKEGGKSYYFTEKLEPFSEW